MTACWPSRNGTTCSRVKPSRKIAGPISSLVVSVAAQRSAARPSRGESSTQVGLITRSLVGVVWQASTLLRRASRGLIAGASAKRVSTSPSTRVTLQVPQLPQPHSKGIQAPARRAAVRIRSPGATSKLVSLSAMATRCAFTRELSQTRTPASGYRSSIGNGHRMRPFATFPVSGTLDANCDERH